MTCLGCGGTEFYSLEHEHTLLAVHRESGHYHDPNRHRQIFECKNGHRIEIIYRELCPKKNCDFNRRIKPEAVAEFVKEMEEKTIPAIVENMRRREELAEESRKKFVS